ncbi:NUDIX domain-containing protein [Aurantiacibacter gangjinensis]|uniref:8-oxo-dGTP diphosphatase n=1 Tax=Aurantiacibacter gangjinensis TaxID=502682 RepID=A0A0G9MR16_9SPHN|nr:NUDIX domain-containing protein [Aurantiacibacter gangjinensis]APE28929.1 5-methyl-dCTP pyrophosphohydrolase [Aurantiacibacter gangjinensis]KLE33054.1 hypothetical protein AAW01_03390 [Aurantiacibacter gangjinensis]
MKKIPTWLLVVAVALRDGEGRLFLQERPTGKPHAGLWEFPGGKVETGESPRAALVREIGEELALTLDEAVLRPVAFAEEGCDPAIVLNLYTAQHDGSTVSPQDGQRTGWFMPAEAERLPLAPMDRQLLVAFTD